MTYKCEYCKVVAEHFLAWELHLVARKHQRNVQKAEINKEQAERSIYVAGFPNGTPDVNIFEFFGKFGNIHNIILNRGAKGSLYSCFIEFDSRETVSKVLKEKLVMNTTPLTVTKRHLRTNGLIDSEKLVTKLEAVPTLERQADTLVRELELSPTEISSRRKLCMMLQEAFRPMFPRVFVAPFGSSLNTLGFHGTDLDVLVDFGLDDWSFSRNRHYPGHGPVPSQEERVKIATDILSKAPGISHILPIGKARVPIVKFTHRALGVTCDVSFRNPVSVRNTQLIHHYTLMDKRVRVLMMIIRYWAKLQNVMGRNCLDKLSNYALTIMIIFALQQKSSLGLPSVEQLQKSHEARGRPKDVIDGWDCTVSWSVEHSHLCSRNRMSLYELLKDFFRFYSTFNFETMVACSYLGRPVPKKAFQGDMKELTHMGLQRYVHNVVRNQYERLPSASPMCVQDPFELVFNLTRNVNHSGFEMFRQRCSEAEVLCKNTRESALLPALFRRADQLGGEEVEDDQQEVSEAKSETKEEQKEEQEKSEKEEEKSEKKDEETEKENTEKEESKTENKPAPGAYPHPETTTSATTATTTTTTTSNSAFKLPEKSTGNEPEPGSYATYKAQKDAAAAGGYRPPDKMQPGSYRPPDKPGFHRPMDKFGGYRPMHDKFGSPYKPDKMMSYPPPYHGSDKPGGPSYVSGGYQDKSGGYHPRHDKPGSYDKPGYSGHDKSGYSHDKPAYGSHDKPGFHPPHHDKPGYHPQSHDKPGYHNKGSFQAPPHDKPPPHFHSQDARSSSHKPTGRSNPYHQDRSIKPNEKPNYQQDGSSTFGSGDQDCTGANRSQETKAPYGSKMIDSQRGTNSYNKSTEKGNYYNKSMDKPGYKPDYNRSSGPKNYSGPNSSKNYSSNQNSGPKTYGSNQSNSLDRTNDRSSSFNSPNRTGNNCSIPPPTSKSTTSSTSSLGSKPVDADRPGSNNSSSSADKSGSSYSSDKSGSHFTPADNKGSGTYNSTEKSYSPADKSSNHYNSGDKSSSHFSSTDQSSSHFSPNDKNSNTFTSVEKGNGNHYHSGEKGGSTEKGNSHYGDKGSSSHYNATDKGAGHFTGSDKASNHFNSSDKTGSHYNSSDKGSNHYSSSDKSSSHYSTSDKSGGHYNPGRGTSSNYKVATYNDSHQKNSYEKPQQSFKANDNSRNYSVNDKQPSPAASAQQQQSQPPQQPSPSQQGYNPDKPNNYKNNQYQSNEKSYNPAEKVGSSIYSSVDKNALYNAAPTPSESYITGNKQMPFHPASTPKPETYNANMKKNYAQVVASGKSDGARTNNTMDNMRSPSKTSVYYNSNIKNLSDVSLPEKVMAPNPGSSPVLQTNEIPQQKSVVTSPSPNTYISVPTASVNTAVAAATPPVAFNRPMEVPGGNPLNRGLERQHTARPPMTTPNPYINAATPPNSYGTPAEIMNSSLVSTAAAVNAFTTPSHLGNGTSAANMFNNNVSMGITGSPGPYSSNRSNSAATTNISYGRGLPATSTSQSPYSNPAQMTSMTSPSSFGRHIQMTNSNTLDSYTRNSTEMFSQDKMVPMNLHTPSVRSNPIEIQVTQNTGFGSEFGFHNYVANSPEVVGPDKQTMISSTGLTGPSLPMSTGTELWGDKSPLPMTLSGISGIPGFSRPHGHPADATGAGFQREHPIVSSWPIHVPVVPTDEYMQYGITQLNRSSPMTHAHPPAHPAAPRGALHISLPGSRLAPHFPGVEQGFLPVYQ